jgi:hypothetical protein
MAEEKVCKCIENLRVLISDVSDAITLGMEHDFTAAKLKVETAEKALNELEKCAQPSAPLSETREFLEKGKKELAEFRDAAASEALRMAQWRVFREVRDKVCK